MVRYTGHVGSEFSSFCNYDDSALLDTDDLFSSIQPVDWSKEHILTMKLWIVQGVMILLSLIHIYDE